RAPGSARRAEPVSPGGARSPVPPVPARRRPPPAGRRHGAVSPRPEPIWRPGESVLAGNRGHPVLAGPRSRAAPRGDRRAAVSPGPHHGAAGGEGHGSLRAGRTAPDGPPAERAGRDLLYRSGGPAGGVAPAC